MRTTIYLPDDLAEEVRRDGDGINVSAVCQEALRAALLGPTSKDWVGALATPETYQTAIRKLTAERDQLRQTLDEEQAAHSLEVRALQAQLSEGVSLEFLQLQKSLGRWRTRAQSAEAKLRAIRGSVSHGAR